TDAPPSPNGISRTDGRPLVGAFADTGYAGAAVPTTSGTPLNRPRQDETCRPGEDRTGSAPARPADWQSTGTVEQVLAAVASRPRGSRFGFATDRLGGTEPLGGFGPGLAGGLGTAPAWGYSKRAPPRPRAAGPAP